MLSPDAGGWLTLSLADRGGSLPAGVTWYHVMRLERLGFDPLGGTPPTIGVRLPAALPVQGDGTFTASDTSTGTRGACRTAESSGTFSRQLPDTLRRLGREDGRVRPGRVRPVRARICLTLAGTVLPMTGTDISGRRRAIYVALALLSLFSVALIAARYVYSGEQLFGYLIWNLFLAWIPFGLAIVLYDRHRAGTRPLRLLPLAALWLLFLPNAPYIITDFKHLVPSASVPLWVDIVVIAAPAWTGMLLGFISLYLVQAVVRDLAGARVAWTAAVAVLGLASFGIYLGRVLRWNSWDVLANPYLLSDLDGVVADPIAIGMTVLLASFLTLSYLVVYAFMRFDAESSTSP